MATILTTFGVCLADERDERVKVVTTTETLAAIAREVGGDRVAVFSLSRGVEDPHYVTPTPTLMVQVTDADLFVETGMSLEVWVERVLDGGRNAKIRRGSGGHVYAHHGISPLQIPSRLSRSEGDIHAHGNPHIWLDPINAKTIAANIVVGLIRVDPEGSEAYDQRLEQFCNRIDAAFYGRDLVEILGIEYCDRLQRSGGLIEFLETNEYKGRPLMESLGGWRKKMLPLRGMNLVAYHKTWVYLLDAFDLDVVAHIEPKPGISPTPSQIRLVRRMIETHQVPTIISAPYYDVGKVRTLAEETKINAVVLPSGVGADGASGDYFALFDRITDLLLENARS